MVNVRDAEIILSVIIPTCNRNSSLPRAIYSVLNQNVLNLEVVVVNDSDIPITEDVLSIAKNHTVVFTTNPGKHCAASARNYGVNKARGYFITFLDDDDMYLPGRLNNMLNLARQGDYMMISSGRFYETGDFSTIKPAPRQLFGEISLQDIKYQNDIDIGFMMERTTFIRYGGFDDSYKSLEDWDFIIRVLSEGRCYKFERMDYAVNLDPNRQRVSDNDANSYLKMADRYKLKFGATWCSHMVTHGLSLSGTLSVFTALGAAIRYLSSRPVIHYLRQFKRKISKYK